MNDSFSLDPDELARYRPEDLLALVHQELRGPVALIEQCGELLASPDSELKAEDLEAVLSILRDAARHLRYRVDQYGSIPR